MEPRAIAILFARDFRRRHDVAYALNQLKTKHKNLFAICKNRLLHANPETSYTQIRTHRPEQKFYRVEGFKVKLTFIKKVEQTLHRRNELLHQIKTMESPNNKELAPILKEMARAIGEILQWEKSFQISLSLVYPDGHKF